MSQKPGIVYQHQDWLVLNKPAGYSVQLLSDYYSPEFTEFHPVHRLDKDTSGLWLIALNAASNQQLSQLFQNKDITKSYLAITSNKPRKKQGKIIGDMQKSRRGQWQLLKSQNNPAVTQFTSTSLSEGLRLCVCKPITGKTHQIRVAMKANGAAIVGDSYYAKSRASEYDRLYLHAYRLGFTYNDQAFSFELLPDDGELFQGAAFFQALAKLV